MQNKSSPTATKGLLLSISLAWWADAFSAQPPRNPPAPAPAAAAPTASSAALSAIAPAPTAAAPAAEQAHFDIHEYRVLGNTVLANRDIETVLYPLLGDHKTLADVEAARAALEKAFHDHGYGTVFVDIPEQTVDDKIVRLKVTEGRLNEVHIAGARYFSERKILAAVPAATAGKVPNLPELQSQLTTVNVQTADRTVVPVLKAGPFPGTVDLALNVKDQLPFHGSLEFDNQNTPDTKPLRMTASLSYGDLFGRFDNLSLQYQASPQDFNQVKVLAANYAFAPLANGLHPSVYIVDSDSNVPAVSTLGVLGRGQIYGARLAFPMTDLPGMPQSLTLGLDYKHFLQSITTASPAGSASPVELNNTPISYVNVSLAYGGSWTSDMLQGAAAAAANFGPRGAPNDSQEFADKNYKAQANYFYLKLDGSMLVKLPAGFQMSLRADGQFAVEPLITNENISITGAGAVRGYLEAESLSDSGLVGSVQLQSPIWRVKTWPAGDVFVFYDDGHARVLQPLPGQVGASTLRSYGAGLNILPGKWITGVLTWADPLVNGPTTRRGDSRLLFDVRGSF